jgi:hypothetical protein
MWRSITEAENEAPGDKVVLSNLREVRAFKKNPLHKEILNYC